MTKTLSIPGATVDYSPSKQHPYHTSLINGNAGESQICPCCAHTNPDGPREYPTPLFANLTGEPERLDYPDPRIRAKGANAAPLGSLGSDPGNWVT